MRTDYNRDGLRPEVATLLEQMKAGRREPRDLSPAALRANDAALGMVLSLGSAPVAVEREIRVGGAEGELRALLFAPDASPGEILPVVVYFHGGGFVIMTPECSARFCRDVAAGARAIVVSVEYRRAPEDPYPAPLDDCEAAYRWVRAHAAEFGGDGSRVGVAGDSAGGNLAAGVALRTAGTPEAPSGVALACAWLDLTISSPSFAAFGLDDALIDTEMMTGWRGAYVPDPARYREPEVSPLFADVSAYPPACVIVGGIDPLYDDGANFAAKLRAAGRDVELHDYEGMPHIFSFFPQLASLTDAHQRAAAFFKRQFYGS